MRMSGRKDDSVKTWRPGLIAPVFLYALGTVLAFGAKKYAPNNWTRGMEWSRVIDALDRHWTAWKAKEARDPETGYSHLWHAACCLMFLVTYEWYGYGKDDRWDYGGLDPVGDGPVSPPIEGDISHPITVVPTTDNPPTAVLSDDVPNVVPPHNDSPDLRAGGAPIVDPVTGTIIGYIPYA